MSLRDKLKSSVSAAGARELFSNYGVLSNPFPASSQTSNNPHYRQPSDDEAEKRIVSFIRDKRSQVVVIEGTQGVGKTNFLNYIESQVQDVLAELDGFYVVRYLADPEASFDGTIRRLFQELGVEHLEKLREQLEFNEDVISVARSHDMRSALIKLANSDGTEDISKLMMEWLLGFRVLKAHRESLGVHFRLDTVESKTSALRDLVLVSSSCGILNGIFLLLDELEKQDGVLGPTAVVRYLSAMRAIIDSLPNHLFMMIAVTPDAMRRYSSALPAFRSRLQNQISLVPLLDTADALALAKFYLDEARTGAANTRRGTPGDKEILSKRKITEIFEAQRKAAERRGDQGVRQREFLHALHAAAEKAFQPDD
jgi:hypothetical protein